MIQMSNTLHTFVFLNTVAFQKQEIKAFLKFLCQKKKNTLLLIAEYTDNKIYCYNNCFI